MAISCPICSGTEVAFRMAVPLDCKTFKPTSFGTIYTCAACEAGFVHPRPTPVETNAFYDIGAYYTQGKSHMPDTGPPSLRSRLLTHLAWRVDHGRALQDVLAAHIRPGGSIVDIGCGSGGLLTAMNGRGYRAIGVERDAATVSRHRAGVEVLEGSAESLPASLQAGAHEAVVFSHVIEHLVDPVAAMRRAAGLLAQGGLLFCEVPNNDAIVADELGATWEHLDTPRHINFFGQRALHELLKSAGMRLVETYFCGYTRYFSDAYVATEQNIYDRFVEGGWQPENAKRNSAALSWATLMRTVAADPRRKYDSIGVVAAVA